jgi:hypothetical protein
VHLQALARAPGGTALTRPGVLRVPAGVAFDLGWGDPLHPSLRPGGHGSVAGRTARAPREGGGSDRRRPGAPRARRSGRQQHELQDRRESTLVDEFLRPGTAQHAGRALSRRKVAPSSGTAAARAPPARHRRAVAARAAPAGVLRDVGG